MSWRSSVAGIEAESLDSQLAEYFGVKEGVLVRSVVRGSAAEKSGLRAGDVIVKVDDTRISKSARDLHYYSGEPLQENCFPFRSFAISAKSHFIVRRRLRLRHVSRDAET